MLVKLMMRLTTGSCLLLNESALEGKRLLHEKQIFCLRIDPY